MIQYNKDLHYFYSTQINDANFFCAFGTKQTGDGRDPQTIVDFAESADLEFGSLIVPIQIHSVNVAYVSYASGEDKSRIQKLYDTDGIVTDKPHLILSVITADCVPIAYVDKKRGIIGISHQGWRGTLKKLSARMVERMERLGSKREELIVAIGPSIGACCYDIDVDRQERFHEEFGELYDSVFIHKGSRVFLDITRLNHFLLKENGILKEHIDFFPFCTSCDSGRFFSARKAKTKNFEEQFSLITYETTY